MLLHGKSNQGFATFRLLAWHSTNGAMPPPRCYVVLRKTTKVFYDFDVSVLSSLSCDHILSVVLYFNASMSCKTLVIKNNNDHFYYNDQSWKIWLRYHYSLSNKRRPQLGGERGLFSADILPTRGGFLDADVRTF